MGICVGLGRQCILGASDSERVAVERMLWLQNATLTVAREGQKRNVFRSAP